MREQLEQYVNLLFAGTQNCDDIRQEILQNTLDRYDDLIAEGKVPEAAYRLAITGIGDISEILGTPSVPVRPVQEMPAEPDDPRKKVMRAIAIGLYIICMIPLIVLSDMGMDILGLCGTLSIAAVATVLIILGAKKSTDDEEKKAPNTEKSPLAKSITALIWSLGLALYFILSFATNAWHITWVIFPILGALDGLTAAIVDRKETPIAPIRKPMRALVLAIGLILYLILAVTTRAWFLSLLVFPICAAISGLVRAILDLKEALTNEI